ncbi:MAG: hypothetical protein KC561_21730, partial [Myxococcales bacterium]|nr:hypothetical protein [Myxococcales bacterium]
GEPDTEESYNGPTGFVGSPCQSESDCDFDGAVCLGEELGYPDGMCAQACDQFCPDADGHPTTFCTASEAVEGGVCHSRCDYLVFPGTGCRDGYTCSLAGRWGDASTTTGTCLPGDGEATAATACQQELLDRGVLFEPTTYSPRHPEGSSAWCTVDDPIKLHSPVLGVNYRYYYDDEGYYRPMLMSCALALSIADMSDVLTE